MQEPTTNERRLLAYAAHRLGQTELARRLKTSEPAIQAWLDGKAEMPNQKRLALADLVKELTTPPHQ